MKNILFVATLFASSSVFAMQPDAVYLKQVSAQIKKNGCTPVKDGAKAHHITLKEKGNVTIVSMGAEGCGGGNNWNTTVQAFYEDGKTDMIHVPAVETITGKDDVITLQSLEYGEDDPRCCPSQVVKTSYRIKNNKLVLNK